MTEPILVEIDDREDATFYHELLSTMDKKDPKTRKKTFKVERKRLPIGDFIFNKRIVVEHKEAMDYLNSIDDKRIFDQVKNMVSTYGKENSYLLIVGDPIQKLSYKHISIESVFGAMRWCSQNIYVYNACKKSNAVQWIKNLAKYSARDEIAHIPISVVKNKPRFDNISQSQLGLLQIIPKIGISISRQLLIQYDNPINFFNEVISNPELFGTTETQLAKRTLINSILTDKFESEE